MILNRPLLMLSLIHSSLKLSIFLQLSTRFCIVQNVIFLNRCNLCRSNKLYKINPNICTLHLLPDTFSGRELTASNRLLIGHSHLTHSYLINKDQLIRATVRIFMRFNNRANFSVLYLHQI